MAKDTLTLILHGDVPLALFATALEHFDALIKALAEEVTEIEAAPIEWQVYQLKAENAVTTIRGVSQVVENQQQSVQVERVVKAYSEVGRALEYHQTFPFSDQVFRPAKALTSMINGHISSMEFITDDYSAVITEQASDEETRLKQYSLGVITGVVVAISDKPDLKISIHEQLFDRVVYCFLNSDQHELARSVWRKKVVVTGLVFRDPESGRPVEIREVYKVQVVEPTPSGSFKEARGIFPWKNGGETSDASVRRVRDA